MDDVSKTFRDYDHSDPRKDRDGITSRLLQQQLQGYKNEDPGEVQQKAIPFSVIRNLHTIAENELEKAMADLDTGAMYYCMRSAEYTKVPDQEEKRTKLLKCSNIRFFKDGKLVPHSSIHLADSDSVSITFETQKNEEKNETVTQERTDDPILCPVKSFAKRIHQIRSHKNTTSSTPINTVKINGRLYQISSKDNINFLRKSVNSMDTKLLGFEAHEIGTHSIRSGGAMAMKLAGIDDTTIQLLGRWKSNSFLKYIRKQIAQFTSNISKRMLENQSFTHIPNFIRSPSK